jgi:hypothetical protein
MPPIGTSQRPTVMQSMSTTEHATTLTDDVHCAVMTKELSKVSIDGLVTLFSYRFQHGPRVVVRYIFSHE